jgi:nucleotide-binding universal stress UspA family protein
MFKDILLPVDLGVAASWKKALPTALALCQAFGARLHVMTVVPDFGMSVVGQFFPPEFEHQALEAANKQLHAFVAEHVPTELKVQHIVAHGTVYEEILRVADELKVDLVVMGSHRPELRDYLIGPNASRVTRHTNCSVLIVRD